MNERRRRGLRHLLAAAFALPPVVMVVLRPARFGAATLPWPVTWQIAATLCIAASLAVGWKPTKEAWTGEDHHVYVDEPDIDDDWNNGGER